VAWGPAGEASCGVERGDEEWRGVRLARRRAGWSEVTGSGVGSGWRGVVRGGAWWWGSAWGPAGEASCGVERGGGERRGVRLARRRGQEELQPRRPKGPRRLQRWVWLFQFPSAPPRASRPATNSKHPDPPATTLPAAPPLHAAPACHERQVFVLGPHAPPPHRAPHPHAPIARRSPRASTAPPPHRAPHPPHPWGEYPPPARVRYPVRSLAGEWAPAKGAGLR
jgi:hypothetical protein